jgi:hypothetical protein
VPVIQKTVGGTDVSRHAGLVAALASELATPKVFGQPLVMEEEFPRTNRLGVTVIWDQFDQVSDLDRPLVIRKGYEAAQPDKTKRIAFAIGYTVPEAEKAGLLPHEIALANGGNKASSELIERCHDAMKALGGSLLANPMKPVLRFPTSEQADACRAELIRQIPESEPLWTTYLDLQFHAAI